MSDQTITPPEGDGYQYASLPLSFDIPRGLAAAAERGWEFLAIDPSPRVPTGFGSHEYHTAPDGSFAHGPGPTEPFGLFRRDLSRWSTTGERKHVTRFVTTSSSTLTTSMPGVDVTREEPEVRVLRQLVSDFYGKAVSTGVLGFGTFTDLMGRFVDCYAEERTKLGKGVATTNLGVAVAQGVLFDYARKHGFEQTDPMSIAIKLVNEEHGKLAEQGFIESSRGASNANGELADAAIAFILASDGPWPENWDDSAFHNNGRMGNLIKAAALLVAEIERQIERLSA